MLAKAFRLTSGAEFKRAARKGRRAGSHTLVVHLAAESEPLPLRAGFVVGKQVGPAVRRNRVKRQLRHLVSDRLATLPVSGLLVVRALPGAAAAGYADLAADLDRCLSRVTGPARS